MGLLLLLRMKLKVRDGPDSGESGYGHFGFTAAGGIADLPRRTRRFRESGFRGLVQCFRRIPTAGSAISV